jgi:hypothetical protein
MVKGGSWNGNKSQTAHCYFAMVKSGKERKKESKDRIIRLPKSNEGISS